MLRIGLSGIGVLTCLFVVSYVGMSQDKISPKKPDVQLKDAEGFALPAGAVARLGTLRGVEDQTIEFLALSADGKKVATLPRDIKPTLRIWEVPSGKLLEEIPLKMKLWESMALSPDFQKLVWTYLDNSVTVVELATGKESVLNAPTDPVRGVVASFSDDGKTVTATFSREFSRQATPRNGGSEQWITKLDFEIVEWTLADRKKRLLWKDEKKDQFKYRKFAFAPDRKSVAYIKSESAEDVADFEQEFVLEDSVTRKPRLKIRLKDGSDCLLEFSPDGAMLALADEDSLKIIDPALGNVRWTASYKDKIRRPEQRWTSDRKPWPDGLVWLHGGDVGVFFHVGELWTWKTSDGTPSTHYASQATKPLAVAKDAAVLAFTQDRRALQFFDTSKGKVLQPVQGHRNPPSVLFRHDGSLVSHDLERICIWTSGGWRLRNMFEFHDKGQSFFFGPSQEFFVRTVGTKVETRSLEDGKVIKEWTLKSAPDYVFLMPDGKTLVAGNCHVFGASRQKEDDLLLVRRLDISTGAQKEISLPHLPWEVKLSLTNGLLAVAYRADSRDCVDILNTATGKLRRLIDDKNLNVSLLDFAPDGRKLYYSSRPVDSPASSRGNTSLASIELSSGKIARHKMKGDIQESAFSPDNRLFVYSPVKHETRIYSKDAVMYTTPSNEIVVWEVVSESERVRFEKTNAWVKSVSCSPDSHLLATGMYDSTILIWDLQKPGGRK